MRRYLILRKARRLDREVLIPFFPFLVKSVHAVWTRKRQKISVAQQRCEFNDRGPETVDTLRNPVHGDDDTTVFEGRHNAIDNLSLNISIIIILKILRGI